MLATSNPNDTRTDALTDLLRLVERMHQRQNDMESELRQLQKNLADEQQRRRVLSGRVDGLGWTG